MRRRMNGEKGNCASRGMLSFCPEQPKKQKKGVRWVPWWFGCLPLSTTRQGHKVEANPLKFGGKWISWEQHLASRKTKSSVVEHG